METPTKRQREIIALLNRGKKPKEIALILGCSFSTVRNHISQAAQRCGVRYTLGRDRRIALIRALRVKPAPEPIDPVFL